MDHPDILRHEALTNGLFLSSVEPLIIKPQTFDVKLISAVKLLRWGLLKKDIHQSAIHPLHVMVL